MKLYYRNRLIGECNIRQYVIAHAIEEKYLYNQSKYDKSDKYLPFNPYAFNESWIYPNYKIYSLNNYNLFNDNFRLYSLKFVKFVDKGDCYYVESKRIIRSRMMRKLGSNNIIDRIIRYDDFWHKGRKE
jgi:hypothetical protein